MKLMNIFSFVLFFATALGFQSCSDDDNEGVATALSVTRDGVEISELSCPMGETTVMLSVNTDGDWTASVPEADNTWLAITPHEGYGWAINDETATNRNSYIKVTAARNQGEARTSTLTVKAGDFTREITVSQAGISTGPGSDPIETVWEMIEKFTIGYNLGNTLESNPVGDWWVDEGKTTADWETSWGQPVTTQQIIDNIYNQGFKVFRVPVTWGRHMDENNQIDAAWIARVKEVVDYVLSHEDAYCIINVMHDTGTEGWLYADDSAYPELTVKYQAIWQQVATYFRDYDGRLIFESFNEILNSERSWTPPAAGDGAYDAINKLQQDFVNTVRATGGNNEYRNLAVTTYAATTAQTPIDEFVLPSDTHLNHLYVSFHSYDPYNFCNDNSGDDYDWNIYVFDASCQEEIDNIFTRVSARMNNVGVPYIFGEFGAIDEGKDINERINYAKYIARKFRDYGTTGLWWMGLHDRKTNDWYDQEIVDALMSTFGR